MPELRKDSIIGRWVIISTERSKRPDQFGSMVEKEELAPGEKCPFCEGNESMTPPEIYALRKPGTRANTPGCEARAIPSISPLLQLIGTPVNLKRVKEELAGAKKYYEYKERCIFCDIIKQELEMQKRVIAETKYFIAITPFASRFPFETWVLPKAHSCDYYRMNRGEIPDFVDMIELIFGKLKKV